MATRWRKLWTEDPVAALAGSFALLAAVWGLWMAAAIHYGPFPYNSPYQSYYGIELPILAIELAKNQSDISAILIGPEAGTAIYWNTWFDCVLIPLYCSYLFWFTVLYRGRKTLCLLLTVGVGLLDAVENFCIFRSLQGAAPLQHFPSVAKWFLLSLAALYIAGLLCGKNPGPYSLSTRRLLGLQFVSVALLVFVGSVTRQYSWLALGTRLFLLTFVINAIGLVGVIFAVPGHRLEFEEDFCAKRKKPGISQAGIKEIPEPSIADKRPVSPGA